MSLLVEIERAINPLIEMDWQKIVELKRAQKTIFFDIPYSFIYLLLGFGNTKQRAGKRVRSHINAVPIIPADKIPNWYVGKKEESSSIENPETRIVVVIIRAEPVFMIVDFIAIFLLSPFLSSFRYRNKKCKLSSTAIPSATEKVIAVGGLIDIPNQDKMPNTVNMGIRFVTRLANKIDFVRNKNAITMLMKKSAIPRLSTSDWTR